MSIRIPDEYRTGLCRRRLKIDSAIYILLLVLMIGDCILLFTDIITPVTSTAILLILLLATQVFSKFAVTVDNSSIKKARIIPNIAGYTNRECFFVKEDGETTCVLLDDVFVTEEEKPYLIEQSKETVDSKYYKAGYKYDVEYYLYTNISSDVISHTKIPKK